MHTLALESIPLSWQSAAHPSVCVCVCADLRGHAGRGVPATAAGDAGGVGGARALLAGGQGADESCVRTGRDGRQLRQLEDDRDAAILQVSVSRVGVDEVEDWDKVLERVEFLGRFSKYPK